MKLYNLYNAEVLNDGVIHRLLSCVYFNARSLKNKLVDLHCVLYNDPKPDICFITESWLNSTVTNAMLDPHNEFNIFRYDRINKSGGGVVILINSDIDSVPVVMEDRFSTMECVGVDLLGEVNVRFLTFYKPPSSCNDNDDLTMSLICDFLEMSSVFNGSILIVGDFNCDKIDWLHSNIKSGGNQLRFLNTVIDLGFQQYILEPTRGENVLDILLCNDPLLISDVKVSAPFSTSDHSMIDFVLNLSASGSCIESPSHPSRQPGDCINVESTAGRGHLNGNSSAVLCSDLTIGTLNWGSANWDALEFFLLVLIGSLCFRNLAVLMITG